MGDINKRVVGAVIVAGIILAIKERLMNFDRLGCLIWGLIWLMMSLPIWALIIVTIRSSL